MIYLLLDTNIWIYLANGFDTSTNKYLDKHFQLLRQLMDLNDDGRIRVLVTDLIIEEWKRNKKSTEGQIAHLYNKINSISPIIELSKYIKTSLTEIKDEYIKALKEEIKANEIHIKLLEKFLFNDCFIIPLSDTVKLKVFEHATLKKAPFHNNKNNHADAAILFSLPEYFKGHLWQYGDSVMFVSNNTSEFADNNNPDLLHPDIITYLDGFKLKYFQRLPKALDISEEIIAEIDLYFESQILDYNPPDCMMSFCDYEMIHLENELQVFYQIELEGDPNQLSLFPEIQKRSRREKVIAGNCPKCETLYFQCPKCFEITCVNNGPEFFCIGCNSKFSLREHQKNGSWTLFVFNEFDESNDDEQLLDV